MGLWSDFWLPDLDGFLVGFLVAFLGRRPGRFYANPVMTVRRLRPQVLL